MKPKIYNIAKNLGLNQRDIDSVLRKVSNVKEEHYFVMGSPTYAGLNYGTVSIKDF